MPVLISQLITFLEAAMESLGDVEVLTDTDGCGYGEPDISELRIDNQETSVRLVI